MGDLVEIQTPHTRHEDRQRAIKAAMSHQRPEAADTILPDVDDTQEFTPMVFNADMLVKIAIEQFGGSLGARPIWDAIKHDYPNVSHSNVSDMVKQLAKEGAVEYDGTTYELVKNGRGWKIDLDRAHEPHAEKDTEPRLPEPAEVA
jgi:hypothetical protein